MSKYDPLWKAVSQIESDTCTLSYEEIENLLGFPVDHSFLSFKKELLQYGWSVVKISMKNKTILFKRTV